MFDAKYGYKNKIFDKDGEMLDTDYAGKRLDKLAYQADRQIQAIGDSGYKLEWHLSNSIAAKGVKDFFAEVTKYPDVKKAIENGLLTIKHIEP